MTGIVDNFQLHTLLIDVFPLEGLFPRRRIAKQIVDVANGHGPQQARDTIIGTWNLYNWTAVQANLKLPAPDSSPHWIWGEGRPEDIPVFEGHRVVFLGPPSYTRSWRLQRTFLRLSAEIQRSRTLNKCEVTAWLQRMAAAK